MNWDQLWPFVGATGLGLLAAWRSKKADAVTAQSGTELALMGLLDQVQEERNALRVQLQENDKTFREELRASNLERETMRLELAKLRKRYGVPNGDNGVET